MSENRDFNVYIDSPLSEVDDKTFENFAENLSKAINEFYPIMEENNNSFVISLNGEWGSGKTTMLNLFSNKIKEYGDITIINFNPWNFSSSEDLIRKFFLQVFSNLNKSEINKPLLTVLKKYMKIIGCVDKIVDSKVTNIASNLGSTAVEFFEEIDLSKCSLSDIKEELNEKLNHKKLLVIIDDIDRLLPNQLLEIFQLVKSVGDLKNIVYVLSFDKAIVNKNLENVFAYSPEKYLEKIIQISFDIPRISVKNIQIYFKKSLKKLGIDIIKSLEEGRYEYLPCSYSLLSSKNAFENFRKIKRYLNVFSFEYNLVKNSVWEDDFVAITYLKNFHFNVYNKIFNNKKLLTNPRKMDRPVEKLEMFLDGEWDSKKSLLEELLSTLFPTLSKYYDEEKSKKLYKTNNICNEEYFENYFSLIPFSKCECNDIFCIKNYEELKDRLDQVINESGKDVFIALRMNIDNANEEELKNFLSLTFSNWSRFEKDYRINKFTIGDEIIRFLEVIYEDTESINILLLNAIENVVDMCLIENINLLYIIQEIFVFKRKREKIENKVFKLFMKIYNKLYDKLKADSKFLLCPEFKEIIAFIFYNISEVNIIDFSKVVYEQILKIIDARESIELDSVKGILKKMEEEMRNKQIVLQEEDLVKMREEISIIMDK